MEQLAHGGATDGPNFEALVLAVPMVVMGVVLFFQKTAKPIVSVVLVLGGVALAYGGFTFLGTAEDHEDAEAAAVTDAGYANAVQGLCRARDLLAEGDVSGARAAFFDDSHAPLHEIADRLADRDRTGAAELLEAKQAVESGFDSEADAAFSRDVDELIVATVQGLADLDEQVPGCS